MNIDLGLAFKLGNMVALHPELKQLNPNPPYFLCFPLCECVLNQHEHRHCVGASGA